MYLLEHLAKLLRLQYTWCQCSCNAPNGRFTPYWTIFASKNTHACRQKGSSECYYSVLNHTNMFKRLSEPYVSCGTQRTALCMIFDWKKCLFFGETMLLRVLQAKQSYILLFNKWDCEPPIISMYSESSDDFHNLALYPLFSSKSEYFGSCSTWDGSK